MKVVIVMTYFERPHQLKRTLASIAKTSHKDFEVIIVDDASEQEVQLGLCGYPITVLKTVHKQWINPEPAYNMGIYYAMLQKPDVIVLQNAECYHVGDVIARAAEVQEDEYISFGCFSINREVTFSTHDITALLMSNELGASHDGQNAWYNHPKYRPVAYDFCSAMRVENMRKLNGHDERFSAGIGYGDDYLLHRIKALGLKIEITTMPFVVHQWHYDLPVAPNKAELIARNRLLFHQLTQENHVRAEHLYTQDIF